MGHAIVTGGARASAPVTGIKAGDLAVGSSVYLMESGVAVEYLVVNQGIPSSSSLYDSSCDGTWFLRKDILLKHRWHSSNVKNKKKSEINSYINGTYYNTLGLIEKETIKQVKIPYRAGSGDSYVVSSGSNGLSTKILLLSGYELGWTQSMNSEFSIEGAALSYFYGLSEKDKKRIAYLDGAANTWGLRSPYCHSSYPKKYYFTVSTTGSTGMSECVMVNVGVRPAFIIPKNAIFDSKNLILKGVK